MDTPPELFAWRRLVEGGELFHFPTQVDAGGIVEEIATACGRRGLAKGGGIIRLGIPPWLVCPECTDVCEADAAARARVIAARLLTSARREETRELPSGAWDTS